MINTEFLAKSVFGSLNDWKRQTEEIKKEMKKGWKKIEICQK